MNNNYKINKHEFSRIAKKMLFGEIKKRLTNNELLIGEDMREVESKINVKPNSKLREAISMVVADECSRHHLDTSFEYATIFDNKYFVSTSIGFAFQNYAHLTKKCDLLPRLEWECPCKYECEEGDYEDKWDYAAQMINKYGRFKCSDGSTCACDAFSDLFYAADYCGWDTCSDCSEAKEMYHSYHGCGNCEECCG